MNAQAGPDHLVVLAASLQQGEAWCEATFGVVPGPGGRHALMGTHNRLLNIATAAFPRAYCEIIAIDPAATPTRAPPLRRWFDMDDEALAAQVARAGPRLVHWVARVPALQPALGALAAQGFDPGRVLAASRPRADGGLLQWSLTVRDDGRRLLNGALPALIAWGSDHPTDTMADSGIRLLGLELTHPDAAALAGACRSIGLDTPVQTGTPALHAVLQTPRGVVRLSS